MLEDVNPVGRSVDRRSRLDADKKARARGIRRYSQAKMAPDPVAIIAWAVINLAYELGVEVVAEGVETAVSVGCKVAEGYLFGRPMPNPCSDRMAATKFVAQKAAGAAWRPMRGKSASEISPGRRSPVNDAVSVSGTTCVSL